MTDTVVVSASRQFQAYLVLIYLFLLFVVWFIPSGLWLQLFISLLLITQCFYHVRKVKQAKPIRLRLREPGEIHIQASGEHDYAKYALRRATIIGNMMLLTSRAKSNKTSHCLVMRDSVSESDWRLLNRYVRARSDQ